MRRSFGTHHAAILSLAAAGLTACSLKYVEDLWRPADYGVPLTEFQARDGAYFPPFIKKFFTNAARFEQDFPSLAEAASDVKMIEVKQLNPGSEHQNEANLSWSADGVYLSYEMAVGRERKIMLKDLVGDFAKELFVIPQGQQTYLNGIVSQAIQSYNAGLSWSRDSTRFAFMSNGGVGEYNIYVGAVGAKEQAISQSPTKDGYATWSPETNELAFVSGRSGNGDIYLIDLGSHDLTRLSTNQSVDIFPEWFPTGSAVVYSSGDAQNHDLHIVERIKGRWHAPRPLTRWRHDDLRPTVSPNGHYIAFYANSGEKRGTSDTWNIHVVPYVEGKEYNESDLRGTIVARDVVVDLNTGPAWSPDSRGIFYVKRDPGRFNPIYACDLYSGRSYILQTNTRMNRDILMSKLGVLSFRAQVGAWDRVFVALTNQGLQMRKLNRDRSRIHYQTAELGPQH